MAGYRRLPEVFIAGSSLIVVHGLLAEGPLQHGKGKDDREEHQGGSGAPAHPSANEGLVVDISHQKEGRLERPVVRRHHVHLGEHLQAIDDAYHDHEGGDGRQQGQLDPAKHLALGGTIDAGRFQVGFGDALQARQEEDDVIAQALPHRKEKDRKQGRLLAEEPLRRRQAEGCQYLVEGPDARIVKPEPDQTGGGDRHHHRREVRDAEEFQALDLAVKKNGQEKGDAGVQHQLDHRVEYRVPHGLPEPPVGQHKLEVLEADIATRTGGHAPVRQAHDDHDDHRKEEKTKQGDHERCDHHHRRAPLLPALQVVPRHRFRCGNTHALIPPCYHRPAFITSTRAGTDFRPTVLPARA
ncbi:hypothetical protein SDC9_04400 [bioreactor metagenome]|uniref:Uncharacterized protein n=1 Tax=bioreactor metagenome TaxID=1076179 RepID=A0A644SW57_9ZZZZ